MGGTTHPDLERLKVLLREIGEDAPEEIGLLPMPSLRHCGYLQAPQHSLAFATTGGDGVHYSFLPRDDIAASLWPVVMTVPMNFGDENLVVGADLREFLALGIRQGYFELDGLLYNPAETTSWLDREADPTSSAAEKLRVLDAIRQTFEIRPWGSHGPRIAELQAQFPIV